MACNCAKNRATNAVAAAVDAAAATRWGVLTASGEDTGRTFTSPVSAQRFARDIGGKAVPK